MCVYVRVCMCVYLTGISIALTACLCHCLSCAALATLLKAGELFEERTALTLMPLHIHISAYISVCVSLYMCMCVIQARSCCCCCCCCIFGGSKSYFIQLRKCSRRAACLAQTCRASDNSLQFEVIHTRTHTQRDIQSAIDMPVHTNICL